MYRISKMSGRYLSYFFTEIESEAENIDTLVKEGGPVIICNELEDLEDFNISKDEVEIVN